MQLAPSRFVISGGDPLSRGDVYELVDHARRRDLRPAITLSPTANATADTIARLRRNGLSRIIVSLEGPSANSHDASCGVPGSYRRTLHIIGTALTSGIDVEVNTLVTRDNLPILDATYERIERLGVVAWNIDLPQPHTGAEPLSTTDTSPVQTLVERLRGHGLTEVRPIDPAVPTVFITSEGYVRNGDFVSGRAATCGGSSLTTDMQEPVTRRRVKRRRAASYESSLLKNPLSTRSTSSEPSACSRAMRSPPSPPACASLPRTQRQHPRRR